jgi:hypothetical protein
MSEIEIQDLSSNHKYRTEIPNIIFEIGLTPQLIGVYSAIKRCAGDIGSCFKSENTLAKELKISKSTLHKYIEMLSIENPILKKQLLIKENRISENGDFDTNLIAIKDIWPENYSHFETKQGGRVKSTLPSVKSTQGVGENLPKGRVKSTHKEELLKKNLFKNPTTPTSSLEKVGVVVVSISQEEKEAAKALSKWIYNEAHRERKRKVGRCYDTVTWGNLWIMPIQIYEKLIFRHGVKYFQSQLEYMHREQMDFDKGINKKGIDKPEAYLKRACKDNYADSDENKQEKK